MVSHLPDQEGRPGPSQSIEAVLHAARSAFQNRPDNRGDIGTLLELYGSIISLCARAQRIRAILAARSSPPPISTTGRPGGHPGGLYGRAGRLRGLLHRDGRRRDRRPAFTEDEVGSDDLLLDDLRPDEVRQFDGFHQELQVFGRCLTEVDIAAIDLYFPGLENDLLHATHRDIGWMRAYTEHIAPKYGLADRELPAVLTQFLDRYETEPHVGQTLLSEIHSDYESWRTVYFFDESYSIPTQVSVTAMLRIIELLEACRAEIRGIVQENWGFRDLLDRRSAQKGGIYVGEIEYNVSGSQVGAIGPGAHVHDVTFQQQVHSEVTGIDAAVLAEQLERLQAELAKQASERDHYAALVAVSDAAADAREGKTGNAIAKLATVGRWVADIATNIGVSVAAEAIKRATGLD
jgi:hypothetical protein